MSRSPGDSLEDSIQAKLKTLPALATHCCIYKVPPKLFRLNPDAYSPRVVSIGPFHRGKEELRAMEEHKYRYLQSFIRRTSVSLESLVRTARTWEKKARNCYAEYVKLESDEFVEMLVVDGTFLVELILRARYRQLIEENDRIFDKPWMSGDVCRDMMLIENQLPFFVLKDFFLLLSRDYQQGTNSIIQMVHHQVSNFLGNIGDANFDREPDHFVDLLRSCYLPQVPMNLEETTLKFDYAPEVTELQNAGVKFKPAPATSTCLLDIKFADGVLEIPTIHFHDFTESIFRNIIVFEQCHYLKKSFLHYTVLLSCFIRSPADAALLDRSGILLNGLGSAEDVSKLFNSICKEVIFGTRYDFQKLTEDLHAYCNTPRNRWKAVLRRDYFHNPWSIASVVAALLLLILTFIQAIGSILAL